MIQNGTSKESTDIEAAESDFHCTTCSDEALLARVLSVNQAAELALVQLENEQLEVDISLVDAPAPGDLLLVHGGVGLANLGKANQNG